MQSIDFASTNQLSRGYKYNEIIWHNSIILAQNYSQTPLRLTAASHKTKKKQCACTSLALHNHYSELITHMTAVKYANALTKLP